MSQVESGTPGSEFRAIPLWSWNGRLDQTRLDRQWSVFRRMGFGGAMPHARTGLADEYLGPKFLDGVRRYAAAAAADGSQLWLYDEDRWPSGGAGGRVTRDPRWRERWLSLSWDPQPEGRRSSYRHVQGAGDGHVELVARWRVRLDQDGRLLESRLLASGDEGHDDEGRLVYAYREINQGWTFFNGGCPIDALNPLAVQQFINETHERYLAAFGGAFPPAVKAMFTDEPQTPHKQPLSDPWTLDGRMPWTDDLTASYAEQWGEDLLTVLPEVFWERADGAASPARWRFHEHVSARFATTMIGMIGRWCDAHGIALTGHLMEEAGLRCQTAANGESMRCYASFAIPGIDMLCDRIELLTAKQAQSVKHQAGRQRMMSECYGVMGWNAGFATFKAHNDWQAALGVTVRAPHLAWMGMAGEAKRDYPPSFGEQSPWWSAFQVVEDHNARVAEAMSRGKPLVRVAVLHPVESCWLAFGPRQQTAGTAADLEQGFGDLLRWLLHGLIDADLISESLLPGQCPQPGAPLRVGAMAYDAVVVPPLATLRSTTLAVLEAFAAAGGLLCFVGDPPGLVDVISDSRPGRLAARCRRVPVGRAALLAALAPVRMIAVDTADGSPAEGLLAQLRDAGGDSGGDAGDQRHLFICTTDRAGGLAGGRLRVRGIWDARVQDTADGSQHALHALGQHDGWTHFACDLPPGGHLLLSLHPVVANPIAPAAPLHWRPAGSITSPVPHDSAEPNLLPLDRAIWRINEGAWQDEADILAIDDAVRDALALSRRDGGIAQPYTDVGPAPILATVEILHQLVVETDLPPLAIAVEDPGSVAALRLDGIALPVTDAGWWMDEDIRRIHLPKIPAGRHTLAIERGYHRRSGLEPSWLLGDFGVRVAGRHATLTAPPVLLAWGDWCTQGLPFATGARTYRTRIEITAGCWRVAIPHLAAAAAMVSVDGRPTGTIAFPPWRLDLGHLETGVHQVDITVLPTRQNAAGNLHDHDPHDRWYGPHVWRRQGDHAAAEYRLVPSGILTAPRLEQTWPGKDASP